MNVQLSGITHDYRAPSGEVRRVLDIPAWSLIEGAQILLRGVSGSGKTTLFNIMAGLLRPTAGSVLLGETDLYALAEAERDRFRAGEVGYVFQNHHLIGELTALENVVMPLAFAGQLPRARWKLTALDLLAHVGLADFARYRPRQLSTGQRLRVAVARALANRPRLLLADEPTAALDPDSGAAVVALLKSACAERSAVLVVASHDPAWSGEFAHHLDLRGGRLVERTGEETHVYHPV